MRRDQTRSSAPADRLAAGRRELEEAFAAGAPGLDLARRRARLFDEVLTGLWEAADVPDGWSLIALGGYGRAELAPHSDIDLMILLDRSAERAGDVARRVFYPLWDAGLVVGNAVRTVRQALDTAKESLETETTLLDGRLLAGDPNRWGDLFDRLLAQVRRQGGRRFFKALRADVQHRHDEFGQSAYLLEPNIKEGLGGLRDLQAIALVGKALLGLDEPAALASAGELTPEDASALGDAHEFLWTIRTHLHHRAGRAEDRLSFDHQTELARELGYEGDERSLAAERFMTVAFEHTGQVERVSTVFWERRAARLAPPTAGAGLPRGRLADGLVPRSGHIDLEHPDRLAADPQLVLGLFAASADSELPVASEAIQAVQRALPTLPAPSWDAATLGALLRLLGHGHRVLPALELMTQLGVLSHFIPEWEDVRSLVQFDAYHIYTVDLHALHTVAELTRLRDGLLADREPAASRTAREVEDWDTLLLAGLLHDIGKPGGRGHAARGAKVAAPVARRLGLGEASEEALVFLVGNHLLLYNTATRRDLNDERVAIQVAQEIKTPDRLRQLYLLTVADALATGPKAWNPWKSALVSELAVKALHVLERGDYASRRTSRRLLDNKREVMAKLSSAYSARKIDGFLDSMPYSYLVAHEPDEIARHFELIEAPSADEVRTAVREGQRAGLYEFTVVTSDQADLFATVAGALALNGVTIHSAEIYVRTNRQALMVFQVAGVFEDTIAEARWRKVKHDIAGALDGHIALTWRLAERAERYRQKGGPKKHSKPRVLVDNEGSDFYTLVEVYAADRVGLLFTITSALHDLRLRIHQARISTSGDEAADVFYVLDRHGEKVTDPDHISEIEQAVAHALARPE